MSDQVQITDARDLFGGGTAGALLVRNKGDLRCFRPFLSDDDNDPNTYISKPTGRVDKKGKPILNSVPIANTPGLDGTLRLREWIELDKRLVRAARPPLQAFADLRSRGLTYAIPNAMSKTVLQYETMTNITPATISMDGIRRSDGDRPEFNLAQMPLPIIHKDFGFTARQVLVSRNGNEGLDLATGALAARRVGETVEQLTVGALGYQYAGGNIYGYTNFPGRIVYGMGTPAFGTNYSATLADILQMKQISLNNYHTGPWMIYVSPDWDQYMDDDYAMQKVSGTLRERIMAIKGIEGVETLYFLPANTLLMVQMTEDTVEAVVGMDITTLQWPTEGGMMLNFKVMAMLYPRLRTDTYGNTGIIHGFYTPVSTTTTTSSTTSTTSTTSSTEIP